jgi:hypothetical protein
MRALLVTGLALALLVGHAAAAGPPKTTHTATGMAAARHLLVTIRAFPAGWTTAAAANGFSGLTCPVFTPSTKGVIERGAASSPSYRAATEGPFANQSAYVYATAAQASLFWRRVATPGIARCVAQSVTQASTTNVQFKVTGRRPIAAPSLAARTAAYRVTAKVTTPGQTADAYVDLVLVGRGRAISALGFWGVNDPVPRSLEARIARAAAKKLPSG